MFSTLRHSNAPDEPYIVKQVNPPFRGNRQGKLARVACVHCREKKVKCTTEIDGCQRCLARHIDCQYLESPAGSRARNTTNANSALAEVPHSQSMSSTDTSIVSALPEDDFTMACNFLNQADLDTLDVSSACRPIQPEDMRFETAELPAPSTSNDTLTGSVANTELDLDFSFIASSPSLNAALNPEFASIADDAPTLLSNAPEQPPSKQFVQNNAICACFAHAISAYEGIGIQLMGSFRHASTSANGILQHQKLALRRCEDLLRCRECCSRSDFMMLVISMCDRMMNSLQSVLSRDLRRDHREHRPMETLNGPRGSNYADHEASCKRQRLRIGRWQLDDEDEMQVLQSLLMSRFAKLGSFLDAVGKVVSDKNWPAHKDIIQELQERLQEEVSS